jgi:RNA polymerase sigma factor (sigma-70 family)
MARARAHSDGAARELIARYGEELLREIRRRLNKKLRPKYDSIDFAQSVWASFYALPPEKCKFDRPEALAEFILAVAHHKVVDAVRQRLYSLKYDVDREVQLDSAAVTEDLDLVSRDASPMEEAIAREEFERLQRGLPAHYRQILALRREGQTAEEIAVNLGLHLKTVERVIRKLGQEQADEPR